VTGLRGAQTNLYGFTIPHLPHQHDLGRLPQGSPQAVGKGIEVHPQFPLIEGRRLMGMDIFHRIFEGDHMHGPLSVDFIEHGGQGGRFAAARGSRHQHEAVLFLGHLL